jgi:hypothetical protein
MYRRAIKSFSQGLSKKPDDNGKPSERKGRKALGLSLIRGMIARLPNRGLFFKKLDYRQTKKKPEVVREENNFSG